MKAQPQDVNEEYKYWQDYVQLHGVEPSTNYNRKKYEDKEIPPYYTSSKIRNQIHCRLEKLAKENAKVWKDESKLKAIKQNIAEEIKKIDPLYYRELFPEDNVTEEW